MALRIAERFAAQFQDRPLVQAADRALRPALQNVLDRSPAARRLRDALDGTAWLGHPLHPVLTDVPIGAWTMAAVFDAIPQTALAADVCVGLGIAAALPTALAGLADWTKTQGTAARVGVAHAAFNLTALALFIASFSLRRRARPRAVALQYAGNAVLTFGAMLGGHLVYSEGIGVKPRLREPQARVEIEEVPLSNR